VSGINTVGGVVDGGDLGFVLVHEHVTACSPGILKSWPELYGNREQLLALTLGLLADAKANGVKTIVDATTFDLGRDIELLAEVSAISGIVIIATSGHWLDPSMTTLARSTEQLTDFFIRELTVGADGTDIKPGIIKVASQATVEPFEERVLIAAARASVATGAPILTHTLAVARTGEAQAAVLEKHGADPTRVAIGHSDDSPDLDYLSGLAKRGYRIAMDRLPKGPLPEYGGRTLDDRIDTIVELIDRGFGDHILLSHDDLLWGGLLTEEDQRRQREANPDSISFIPKIVLPAFRERGLTADVINRMTVGNPSSWLTGGPPRA
jgi:phosphotriesterase-related protein